MINLRHYLTILENIERAMFSLPSYLNKEDYQITDSIKDVRQWKAKVKARNSGEVPKGSFDDVGYIMVSLKDNTIIPIARSDEHHTGYDMLWSLSKKFKTLKPKDYLPIFWGNNYVHSEEDIPNLLIAMRKYLSYGGDPNSQIKGAYGKLHNKILTAGEFVERNGDMNLRPDELALGGKLLYKMFEEVSQAITTANNNPEKQSLTGRVSVLVTKLLKSISMDGPYFSLSDDMGKIFKTIDSKNIKELEQFVFGFDGLKNKLHNDLRRILKRLEKKEKMEWNDPDKETIDFWGNVPLAVDILGRL